MKKRLKLIASIAVLMGCTLLSSYSQSLQDLLADDIFVVVDQNGSGNFTTIQEAIDSIPDNNPTRKVIFIKKGIYYERVIIPVTKTNLTLVGEHLDSTILTYDIHRLDDFVVHTFVTHTLRVDVDDFWAMNMTIQNTAGDNAGQSLAIFTNGDRQIFTHCRILGWQDTYFNNIRSRNYFKDCFLEGDVDYIFGFGLVVFDSCQIHTLNSGGYITAASTPQDYRFGMVFKDCRLTRHSNYSGIFLGRPWFDYAKTVFYKCREEGINPAGWYEWVSGRGATCYYREYQCYGPSSDTSSRVFFGKQLTDQEASKYVLDTIFSLNTFPIDAVHDTSEPNTIHRRFLGKGYPQQSEYFLKAGRDTFPAYPSSDWHVDIESDSIYTVIKGNSIMFIDTLSYNLSIDDLHFNDIPVPCFNQEIYSYHIEMAHGDTQPGEISVISPNAWVKVAYPASIPNYTTITAYSPNKLISKTYKVYNSVDSAYWNPYISFIKYSFKIDKTTYTDTTTIEPGIFEYNIELPAGTIATPSLAPTFEVPGASHITNSITTLPSTATIKTSAPDTSVHATYTINFTIATNIHDFQLQIPHRILDNPFSDKIRIEINPVQKTGVEFELYDMSGRLVFNKKLVNIQPGISILELDASSLQKGAYIYNVKINNQSSSGKLIKL